MDTGLAGKGVLVTGGAGGIGTAIVRAFADEGASVAIHYRTSTEMAEQLAAEVDGVALRADLTVEAEADALIPAAVAALGRLDVVCANAGWWPPDDEPIWEMSLERWRTTIDANLTTTFLTARAFLRHASVTGTGSLILTASTAGQFGEAGHADYAAAKGALQSGLLLTLKNEAARIGNGVRVNAINPGWIVTPKKEASVTPEHVAWATSTMSLKKLGVPADVASQAVILASDKISGHLSGQVITVAGGMEGRVVG
jgi:3-oxoacyl-[acyl-carrier protein] reductase